MRALKWRVSEHEPPWSHGDHGEGGTEEAELSRERALQKELVSERHFSDLADTCDGCWFIHLLAVYLLVSTVGQALSKLWRNSDGQNR